MNDGKLKSITLSLRVTWIAPRNLGKKAGQALGTMDLNL